MALYCKYCRNSISIPYHGLCLPCFEKAKKSAETQVKLLGPFAQYEAKRLAGYKG